MFIIWNFYNFTNKSFEQSIWEMYCITKSTIVLKAEVSFLLENLYNFCQVSELWMYPKIVETQRIP